jgi:outer membrane protein OmpA-like peptidoglycan-associated protein
MHSAADKQMVRDAMHDPVKNGVITQSTIYPHHFVQHTPTINGLGGRDLDILADHYINDVMPVSKPVNVVDDVNVYFDYDKSDIRADGTGVLDKAIATLRANPATDVIITGRADVRGSDEYNEKLGNRRAGSVSSYLRAHGVDPNRVRIVSRGEMDALAPESDEAGMQKDRNAHFIVAEVNQYPLPLNVRQGNADDNLYQARKRQVIAYLQEKGVDTDLLRITDGFAGGPGLQSQEVYLIVTDTDTESTQEDTFTTVGSGN